MLDLFHDTHPHIRVQLAPAAQDPAAVAPDVVAGPAELLAPLAGETVCPAFAGTEPAFIHHRP